MRILFSSTAGGGHFHSLIPFIDACMARGQQVLVAGPGPLGVLARSAGYQFVGFEAPDSEQEDSLRFRQSGGGGEPILGEIYGRLRPQASLPVLQDIFRTWQPETVVREAAEFGSALVAEQHQIPVVRVSRLASFEDDVVQQSAQPLHRLRQELGLPADPDAEGIRRSPSLTFWPASLEDPNRHPPNCTLRFRDPRWDALPRQPAHGGEKSATPLIYVTFGTVTRTLDVASQVYTTVAEAVSELQVRALLTAGRAHGQPYPFPPLPPNMRAESWVDEADVVPRSALVVCHGGGGSILVALATGVPLVIVPLFGDQHANGRLVREFGAGVVADLTTDSIRRGILNVLSVDTYRSRAGELAQEMRAHRACETVVDVLAEIAQGASRA